MQNYTLLPDSVLLEKISKNDTKAFEILHDRYFVKLCEFALQYLGNIECCEEVVSDVFVNIWLKREHINIHSGIRAYLYKSTKNAIINFCKSNEKHPELKSLADHFEAAQSSDAELHYQEINYHIERLLDKLPEKRRIIFKLNRLDGLKYQEIADILSISIHTVQNQMIEAIKTIAEEYPRIRKMF